MNNYIFTLFLLASCASLNSDSKKHYEANKPHGIVRTEAPYKPSINIKSTPKLIAAGKKLYQANCLQCHGSEGRGNGPKASEQSIPPSDLYAAVNEVEHFAFYTRFSYWDGRMPGWSREFSDQELDALTAYLNEFKVIKK
ncbi:MAG: hypothetical protein CME71_09410 [Halobacteriovorax sp.]|nr:hypothetical protein [Halobacteriovorax sp.]